MTKVPGLKAALDWITTIPTLLAFAVTLIAGDLLLRVARLFGDRSMEIAAGFVQRTLISCFRISGTKIDVDRHPDVRPGCGYIFLSNHQSLFDIPIFGGLLFSNFPKYVAKLELGRWIPLVSYNLRRGGNALIDRNDRRKAIADIRQFGETCQSRGVSAVIFPEGSRSRDGMLKPFRSAGSTTLLESAPDLPVVPTAIDGSWRLLENRLFPIPFGTRIRVEFGAPILRNAGENAAEILAEARDRIAASLESWRTAPEGTAA